ncbi:MAG: AMP-binding protein [Myxococcota bacterium]
MSRSESLSLRAAARDVGARLGAVVDDVSYTYAALWSLAQPLVARVAALGSQSHPLAFVAHGSLETLLTVYACLEAGVPFVPLHPRLGEEERRELVRLWPNVRGLDAPLPHPKARPETTPADIDDESALAIVHSSGTTGAPKGVVLSRRAFLASAHASAANLGWQPEDRWLVAMPLAHVGGLSVLVRTLLARRTVVVASRFDVHAWTHAVARHAVTLASLVPTMLVRLIEEAPGWRVPPHLRAVLLGGDAAPPELVRRATAAGWPLLTTYGLSEACSQVATQPYPSAANAGGVVLAGMEVKISAAREIMVRGVSLFSGYYASESEPSLDAEGFFPTGDLGELDEQGRLHVLGRRCDTLISGGENVQPQEVEAALATHAKVREALVGGLPDPVWGQKIVALIAPRHKDAPLAGADLDAWARARLASFKCPKGYYRVDELPRTPQGKVDRRALVAALDAPLPW